MFGGRSLSITYSLGMLIWSVTFIEMWKRKEHELAVEWNVRNCSKHERKRVEFKGDRTVKDQVTGEEVPYCPPWKIFTRRAMSIPGVAIGAAALSVIVACVFVLQLFLHEYYNGPFRQILASGWIDPFSAAYANRNLPLALCTHHWLRLADSNNDQHLQRLDAYTQQL